MNPARDRAMWIVLMGCLVISVAAAGQDLPASATPLRQIATADGGPSKAQFMPGYKGQAVHFQQVTSSDVVTLSALPSGSSSTALGSVVRITLSDAQQQAAVASNPLARLGELQVEVAKQHRLGVQAQYFPAMSTSFMDLHYNKHPGDVLSAGPLGTVSVNIINKDSNSLNLMAVQPLTPLFSIYQLAKIARADENIARAKAGMPVAEIASKVEKNFFELLVAQRELISANADANKIRAKWLTASSSGVTSVSTEQETDMISAEKVVIGPASKVKELTATLDGILGLPIGTELDLVPPDPLVENISLNEAAEKAMANPEVIEAQQTAIKAHAGLTATKLTYVPTVGVLGGYAFQDAINRVLPRSFGYIGVSASWTIFDFGKREHGVKEVKAQAEMADLGVQLTKAKVAAAVKSSYFELERSRQFTQLARRMASSVQVVEASYKADDPEVQSARAKLEADMFRAELEYRQAYARLMTLVGNK
ncbi:MAG TPA: TolC family protein [Terriglobales bacterium]|nr:TolC family protein [Terriglobales bacterium]